MRRYVFTEYCKRENTALNKAPEDVMAVARRMDFEAFPVKSCVPATSGFLARAVARLRWFFEERRISSRLRTGDTVLLQCAPGFFCRRAGRSFMRKLKERGIRFIYFIHDIGELRERDPEAAAHARMALRQMLEISEAVVAHNDRMKAWLVERGYPAARIVVLGVFDYLFSGDVPFADGGRHDEVIVAGNLSVYKSAYLAGLKKISGIEWKLYGPNYDPSVLLTNRASSAHNIAYGGSFEPDDLPRRLAGSWGLVWDGDSIDTCSGATGSYLRYNNPHKLSLFITCGIPVIIWAEAAEAPFVSQCGLGLTVGSLRDLPHALSRLTDAERQRFRENVRKMSARVRQGDFTATALAAALEICAPRARRALGRGDLPAAPPH